MTGIAQIQIREAKKKFDHSRRAAASRHDRKSTMGSRIVAFRTSGLGFRVNLLESGAWLCSEIRYTKK
jgi:hypothetical protein